MAKTLRETWYSPVFSSVLANRMEGLLLAGIGSLQLGLHLLGLPGWACPIRSTLGIPCPGCGLTDAIGELLHGHLEEALAIHAFAPVFLFVLLLMALAVLLPRQARTRFSEAIARLESRTGITAWVLSGLMFYWSVRLFGLV
ncbi:MAG: DUF2752 domain-containing protein [Chloroflexi bacterium]|nr:DUF2752 domain-containing protein [Chloroflexota bacterium]